MILTARVLRQSASQLYSVQLNHDGPIVVQDERYDVASAIAEALTHPEWWEPTEAYEVAEAIRQQRGE